MPEIIIATPDSDSVAASHLPIIRSAQALIVSNQEQNRTALLAIKDLTVAERGVSTMFAEPKKAANAAHKSICALETKLLAPLTEAKRIVSGKCDTYERAERQKAEEEQKRLEVIARKQEADRLAKEAARQEERGDKTLAAETLDKAVAVETGTAPAPVVTVAPAVAKVEGVSSRTIWSASVVDKVALIKYVAEHPEWASLLDPNVSALNGLARTQKDGLAIPGVKAVSETSRAMRV